MGIRDRFQRSTAAQLGRPQGLPGRLVARLLNHSNRNGITAAIDLADVRPAETASDLGFGGGIGLRLLLDRVGPYGKVAGIDLSPDMVARARRKYLDPITLGRLTVQVGSLNSLPLPDAQLDAAVTVNTIYFVDDLGQAFAELHRVLRPEGRLVIAVGDPDAMARMPYTPYGFTLRPIAEILQTLERAGFSAISDRRSGTGPAAAHLFLANR